MDTWSPKRLILIDEGAVESYLKLSLILKGLYKLVIFQSAIHAL